MEEIAYRLATLADVETLTTFRAAFLAEVNGDDPADPALLKALTRYFSTSLASGEFTAYLAEADGCVVATSGLVYHRHPPSSGNLQSREAYVMNMYTLPAWRGRGIAASLLEKLIAVARASNCCRVSLHALPAAKAIYTRAGFTSVDSEMRFGLG